MMASEELLKAIRRVKRADTELTRAIRAGDGERKNRAGTDFRVAMNNLYSVAGMGAISRDMGAARDEYSQSGIEAPQYEL